MHNFCDFMQVYFENKCIVYIGLPKLHAGIL